MNYTPDDKITEATASSLLLMLRLRNYEMRIPLYELKISQNQPVDIFIQKLQ